VLGYNPTFIFVLLHCLISQQGWLTWLFWLVSKTDWRVSCCAGFASSSDVSNLNLQVYGLGPQRSQWHYYLPHSSSTAISTVLDLILIDHLDFSSWETIPPSWLTVKPRNSLAVDETVAQWSSIASTNQRDKDNWVVNSTIHRVYRMEESGCTVQFCHWEYRC